ncbi:glycoside hydrolase family 75 protein [Amycolatopsis silviterrae]|uniref:Glycoside hydrolase family 75 protein n=1 Tax=Amycolatopsis silviterrae TaxID=1656914 RepID=A0ABW5H112_9PSEU
MRKLLFLAILAITTALLPAAVASAAPPAATPATAPAAPPTADQLLSKLTTCTQTSTGKYKTDEDSPSATIPVCDAGKAVFWKADMDIDCDGQRTDQCNENTDCCFLPETAFPQSDGQPLNAAELPYIVVPSSSPIWNYQNSGLNGGGSCAVIYNGKIEYAVIGDTGPDKIIGEASYATANALGINPDPKNGGVDSGVTYVCFKDSTVNPIEDHQAATDTGQKLASEFVGGN